MSDQTGLVTILSWGSLPAFRDAVVESFGKARLRTVSRYTSGPQTLDGTQDLVTCDCAGGSFTVNLPASPIAGDTYEFFKETAGNVLTIGRNGKTLNFVSADSTLTAALSSAVLTWSAAANTWLLR